MIRFFAAGSPAPKGSGRAITHAQTGKATYLPGGSRKGQRRLKAFTDCVRWAAVAAMRAQAVQAFPPLTPIKLRLVFWLDKPRTNKDGEPIRKPDLSKLLRCAEDALTGQCYDDDARVIELYARKRWADHSHPPGVEVEVSESELQK